MWAEVYVSENLRESEAERAGETASPERMRAMLRVVPGKEREFRYLRGWLAVSDRLDRLIAATEPAGGAESSSAPAAAPSAAAQLVAGHADTLSPQAAQPPGRPALRLLARLVGQALRRMGQALEAWGSSRPTAEANAPLSSGLQGGN